MIRPRFIPKAPKGERIKSARPVGEGEPCGRCGRRGVNPERRHKSPDGVQCPGVRAVNLDEVPPVRFDALPPRPKKKAPGEKAEPRPRVARGVCHDCGKPVTGERRYCGLCLAQRMYDR